MVGTHLGRANITRRRVIAPSHGNGSATRSRSAVDLLHPPRLQDIFNPIVVMLMGPRGKGKTQALTNLADYMRRRYREDGFDHCKVFANYPTDLADVADPFLVDKITEWGNHEVSDGLACIDEIQSLASSAKWNTKENFSTVQTLQQLRKERLECAFTTQYPRGLDKGVLEQIDFFVECRRIGDGFGIAFAVHDWKDQFIDTPKRHRPWPPFWHEADWYFAWFGTKRVYGHYASQGHVIPRYLRENWHDLSRAEWQRLGYQLPAVEEDEDLEEWADAQPPRRQTPEQNPGNWFSFPTKGDR